MDVADARLRVTLQFSKSNADTFTVRLPDTVIASYKGGKRNGLWCGECGIPSRAVLHAGDFLAVLVFVSARWLMLDELQAAFRMLAFSQAGEVIPAPASGFSPGGYSGKRPAIAFTKARCQGADSTFSVRGRGSHV